MILVPTSSLGLSNLVVKKKPYGQKTHPRQQKVPTGGNLEKAFFHLSISVCTARERVQSESHENARG